MRKIHYRHRVLLTSVFILSGLIISRCGTKNNNRISIPELDSMDYKAYIEKGPDSSIYPMHQRVSSQREPVSEFGLQQLFDGNDNTGWFSESGLHAGEWIEFHFSALQAARLQILPIDSFIVARVSQLEVTLNDSISGIYPANANIPLSFPIYKIKIRAIDADGLNSVKPPFQQDTTSTTRIAYITYASHYNSRSFALAELKFMDNNNQLIPVKAIPVRKAKINMWSSTDSRLITDGNSHTGWNVKDKIEHKINLAFEAFTPVTRIALWNGIENKPELGFVQKVILSIAGRPEASFTLKPGYNEYILSSPMVSRLYTLRLLSTKNMSFSEIRLFDGARYYIPYPDSAAVKSKRMFDSLQTSMLSPVLNHRIYVKDRKVVLLSDTVRRTDYSDLPISMLQGAETNEYEAVFRSNGTFEILRYQISEQYGKQIRIAENHYRITGFWEPSQIFSNGHITLQITADIQIIHSENSQTNVRHIKHQLLTFRTEGHSLLLDGYGRLQLTY